MTVTEQLLSGQENLGY